MLRPLQRTDESRIFVGRDYYGDVAPSLRHALWALPDLHDQLGETGLGFRDAPFGHGHLECIMTIKEVKSLRVHPCIPLDRCAPSGALPFWPSRSSAGPPRGEDDDQMEFPFHRAEPRGGVA